jgi:hypothetical protein
MSSSTPLLTFYKVRSMNANRLLDPAGASFVTSVGGRRRKSGTRAATRQLKGNYKKLLWFKQPCQSFPTIDIGLDPL